jgi:chromosome segregation ATPase
MQHDLEVIFHLQNLYEAVRSDRNLYSKNLIESQDEITEMKRKLKIMNHQIDQLKEEITAKESALVKEHLEHQRVEKEKDALKAELQRMKQEAAESKAYIEQQESEERKLLKIISEADQERMRQKKELDQVGTVTDSYPDKSRVQQGCTLCGGWKVLLGWGNTILV